MTETAEARAMARILRQVHKTEDCWHWTGYVKPESGYGQGWFRGTNWLAHRIAFTLFNGEIPEGMQIDHLCHESSCTESVNCPHRSCVNPAHLTATTGRDNTLRGNTLSGINAVKTHCVNGHEFTPENTYIHMRNGTQRRHCRACKNGRQRTPAARAHNRAWWAARRAA